MEVIGMNPATAKLAVELQLSDVDEFFHQVQVDDDAFLAFETLKSDLQQAHETLEGQLLAIEILRADYTNRTVFQTLVHEENQAVRDHNLAQELFGVAGDCVQVNTECRPFIVPDDEGPDMDFPLFPSNTEYLSTASPLESAAVFACTREEAMLGPPIPAAEGSSTSKGKLKALEGNANTKTHAICNACMEEHPHFDLLELGCRREGDPANHAYCRKCLADLIQSSLTDTTLFPPRCCAIRIPLVACIPLCPADLIKKYEDKEIELKVPNPVYCSNRYCSQYVRPENIKADIAVCPECETETCAICRNEKHNGLCPADPGTQMLMEVAKAKQWQRCPKCRTMVELAMGCYHMLCPCGAGFCYICAQAWKTCKCPQWDEHRLLMQNQAREALAHRIVMPEEVEIQEADPAVEVANDMALRLATVAGGFAIDNTNDGVGVGDSIDKCDHNWQRQNGENGALAVCGICHYHLHFVNNCIKCQTRVCNRCLLNRL